MAQQNNAPVSGGAAGNVVCWTTAPQHSPPAPLPQDARALACSLGGEVIGCNALLVPGPGHSARDRSLSIRLDPSAPEGFVVHSFAGDDPIACRDHVKAAAGVPRFEPRDTAPARQDSEAIARMIWREAGPIAGTLAERYLKSRSIKTCERSHDLRFHGSLLYEGRRVAGLLARMRDIATSEPTGIHRTFLDPQGRKLARKMLGRARGACVKLSPDAEVTQGLGIAEGIETALSVMQAGWRPVWACLSAGGIAGFPVLPGVECLTIFADRDETGERAAREACQRWQGAGREALAMVPLGGGDFNDRGAA